MERPDPFFFLPTEMDPDPVIPNSFEISKLGAQKELGGGVKKLYPRALGVTSWEEGRR